MPAFTAKEFLRYSRHLQLAEFGVAGQLALKQAHAVIIGCGGLGAPVSQYLAAAGVGTLTLVDGDDVELSNLQRQVVFTENDIGQSKAKRTAERLRQLNTDISIQAVESHLNIDNSEALLTAADIVVDCTDNFAARYLINDLCKQLGIPWVYASIFQYSGQLAVFNPEGACFRCLFPEPPLNTPDCNTAGVLGALPGILGSLQSAEVLKLLSGSESVMQNHILMVETSDMLFQKFAMRKSSTCPACTGELGALASDTFYSPVCSNDELGEHEIGAQQFDRHRENLSDYLLVDVRTLAERKAFHMEGEHIELDDISKWLETLKDTRELLFYCQSGARSKTAATLALNMGKKAHSLSGGLQAYLQTTLS